MIYHDYNVRTVGIVNNDGVIIDETLYREYAENVKLLADSDSKYFTIINKPSLRDNDDREDIVILFSDAYHSVINYNGLCLTDITSMEISSDDDTLITIFSGEDDMLETYGISPIDAFGDELEGDYCVKLTVNFVEEIKELDDRTTVFFNMELIRTPGKIRDIQYPCFMTQIDSGTSFINSQGITLNAMLSPLMIEPVPISAFGVSDDPSVTYHKIASICKRYASFFKYIQYSRCVLVYDRKKKMINIKHVSIVDDMRSLIIYNESINRVTGMISQPCVYQYYEFVLSDDIISKVLDTIGDLNNIVMVGNAPVISRDKFYNMNEEEISDEIKEEISNVFDNLDDEAKQLDMNNLNGFEFSEIVNRPLDESKPFEKLLDLLGVEEGVLIYEPTKYNEDFHLVFMSK